MSAQVQTAEPWDATVYFSLDQVRRGEGGRGPDVVVELLSPSTESVDRGEKKRGEKQIVYERQLRVPELILYDPLSYWLGGWRLVGGRYEPIAPDAGGRLHSEKLDLRFGAWDGVYHNVRERWLRLFTPDGTLAPTRAEAEAARADGLAARLRAYDERFGPLDLGEP